MNKEEYNNRLKIINEEAAEKIKSLSKEYALSHNSIKIGDIIEDHGGRIKVEQIGYSVRQIIDGYPACVYLGTEITKVGKPSKKGTKRQIYQCNLIQSNVISR